MLRRTVKQGKQKRDLAPAINIKVSANFFTLLSQLAIKSEKEIEKLVSLIYPLFAQ